MTLSSTTLMAARSPAAGRAAAAAARWMRRLSGRDDRPVDVGIAAVLAAEVEPPRAIPVDDDVTVIADEHALLRLPMRAIVGGPHALSRPCVGNQPILALPVNALRPLAIAVGDGVPLASHLYKSGLSA